MMELLRWADLATGWDWLMVGSQETTFFFGPLSLFCL